MIIRACPASVAILFSFFAPFCPIVVTELVFQFCLFFFVVQCCLPRIRSSVPVFVVLG